MLQIATKNKVSGIRCQVSGSEKSETCNLIPDTSHGFTLLEMLVTIAVIGIILAVATSPDLEISNAKKSFENTLKSIQIELSTLHNEAMGRNTTTRMEIISNAGIYTITTYYSSSPTSSCTAADVGTILVPAHTIEVHSKYQITGAAAMANTCFYRDGTASSSVFSIAPIITDSHLKKADITVTIATGYLDVNVRNSDLP